ncbi:MAG: SGNH/GDSL hydrolase family protein [Fibrobacteria bacterium]
MRIPRSYLEKADGLEDKEYVYRADTNGFIGPFFQGDSADLTIAFQGGSTTECQAMEEKNRFPYLAARLLESNGASIRSFNAGVSGSYTIQAINILINKVLPLNPDISVYMENVNDFALLLYQKTYWGALRPQIVTNKRGPIREMISHLMKTLIPHLTFELNNYLAAHAATVDDFAQARGYHAAADTALVLEKYSKAIETYVAICQANGILPVLMTQGSRFTEQPDPFISKVTAPMVKQGLSYGEMRYFHRAFNEQIRRIAAKHSIPMIDLEAAIPQSNRYLYDLVHMNDSGSILAGKCIRKTLQPIVDSMINARKKLPSAPIYSHSGI